MIEHSPDVPQSSDAPAETICDRCGLPNPIAWHAPSPLWNAVMRAEGVEEVAFCCPSCFIEVAAQRGIQSPRWHLAPDGIDLAALWTDADGRTWDTETCLWVVERERTLHRSEVARLNSLWLYSQQALTACEQELETARHDAARLAADLEMANETTISLGRRWEAAQERTKVLVEAVTTADAILNASVLTSDGLLAATSVIHVAALAQTTDGKPPAAQDELGLLERARRGVAVEIAQRLANLSGVRLGSDLTPQIEATEVWLLRFQARVLATARLGIVTDGTPGGEA